ncbi:hypothetical protein, partial [Geodermatophilus sp. CPCC 206100]|uniref:hypothetical protein n=1 Tax=Geodermatophilus sp. CPCC 206100 TaxID=3020054 RepID=UPI003B002EB5
MSEDVDAAFRRFAAAERPGLLRTALELTGDADRAEEAVQVALTRTRLRWGRADPRATAAAALEDAAGRGQVLESLDRPPSAPAPPPGWRRDADAAVADALRRARRIRRGRGAAA